MSTVCHMERKVMSHMWYIYNRDIIMERTNKMFEMLMGDGGGLTGK